MENSIESSIKNAEGLVDLSLVKNDRKVLFMVLVRRERIKLTINVLSSKQSYLKVTFDRLCTEMFICTGYKQ